MNYETLLYAVDGPIATITLNRPEHLNTIVPPMPDEVEAAVTAATRDQDVRVLIVRGAGRAFCAGYDFGGGFHAWDELLTTELKSRADRANEEREWRKRMEREASKSAKN